MKHKCNKCGNWDELNPKSAVVTIQIKNDLAKFQSEVNRISQELGCFATQTHITAIQGNPYEIIYTAVLFYYVEDKPVEKVVMGLNVQQKVNPQPKPKPKLEVEL